MPIADHIKQLTNKRLRILWIVLGALLLVSVTPLWLYHRQVIGMSEQKLQDTERVQQSEITRSLASETLEFEQNLSEQLLSQRQVLALTGWTALDVDVVKEFAWSFSALTRFRAMPEAVLPRQRRQGFQR